MSTASRIDANLTRLEEEGVANSPNLVEDLITDKDADAALKVAGILRIAAVDDQLLHQSPSRRAALDLVMMVMTKDSMAARYQIEERLQSDETCRRLAQVNHDGQKELTRALASRLDIEECSAFRKQLLKALNSELGRLTLQPFMTVGPDPIDPLRKALSAVVDYTKAEAGQAAPLLHAARAAIAQLVRDYKEADTTVLSAIAERIEDVDRRLQEHFDASPASKPAQLSVVPTERRHPLHLRDVALSIPLVLRNDAEGLALDVELAITDSQGVVVTTPPLSLDHLNPGSQLVEYAARTSPESLEVGHSAVCLYEVSWTNADGTEVTSEGAFELPPQDHSIAWDDLRYENPYSEDAVKSESHLMGRSTQLDRVISTLNTASVGSLYIQGQKRVGKTSLAKVALSLMQARIGGTYVYLEMGEINHPDPAIAIDHLCSAIADELSTQLSLTGAQAELALDGSLTPLVRLLKSCVRASPRIVLALDEFDRLPTQLFWRTAQADAFFTALRAVSAIDGIGLVLIGGERMKLIMNAGGVELNRFTPFRVDYLNRSSQWNDFTELVRKPTEGVLEFTDQACNDIYELTAGNPYYTKKICREILNRAVENRDNFVDNREIAKAVSSVLTEIGSSGFAHYWEDYVLEQDARRDEISLNRRRCLLAFGSALSQDPTPLVVNVVDTARGLGMSPDQAERELEELTNRELLLRTGSTIQPRVQLFGRWISDMGQSEITLNVSELESARKAIEERAQWKIKRSEAEDLVRNWDAYRTRTITEDDILAYLHQFGELYKQRLIFKLLTQIRFIDRATEDKLLKQAYSITTESMRQRLGSWQNDQLRITYTGTVGKGSSGLARRFAQANGLRRDFHVVTPDEAHTAARGGVTDVVVVDDFVGTGQTLNDDLVQFAPSIEAGAQLHLFALVGLDTGVNVVEQRLRELFGSDNATFRCLEEVPAEPGPFSIDSGAFDSDREALDAKALVEGLGAELLKNAPLGFGGHSPLVVFSGTIPNNAPPILWQKSGGDLKFRPLFPRN